MPDVAALWRSFWVASTHETAAVEGMIPTAAATAAARIAATILPAVSAKVPAVQLPPSSQLAIVMIMSGETAIVVLVPVEGIALVVMTASSPPQATTLVVVTVVTSPGKTLYSTRKTPPTET